VLPAQSESDDERGRQPDHRLAHRFNPWRILERIATPQDWVVVKLDIDTPQIENELMRQLSEEVGVQALVDEVFYEHHSSTPDMAKWWGVHHPTDTLADSYTLFS